MTRKIRVPVTFEKGVNEYAESSELPEGYALEILNWIPEASGSLRVPWVWLSSSSTGLTGNKVGRGIAFFVPPAGQKFVLANTNSGTQYRLQHIPADNLAAGTWSLIELITANPSTRPMAMAAGAGYLLYCTPEFPNQRIRRWDGTTVSDANTATIAGRALVYHNNRFFVGGSTAEPTHLRWSELGDSATWTVETNFQPIGQDDGEPIEDLASWDRALFIGKENSIWVQTGFGLRNFDWRMLDGGGCAPGRTLVPTPQGIMAIGRERIWWFEGGGFSPISQGIEDSYGMTGNYMSGAYIDDVVYVCDEGSGNVWAWDLATKAWHTERFDTVNEGPGLVRSTAEYLFGLAKSASTNGPVLYKRMPGTARTRAPGSAMTYRARSGDTRFAESVMPSTARHIYCTVRQRAAGQGNILSIEHYVDDVLRHTDTWTTEASAGVYQVSFAMGGTGFGHRLEFEITIPSNEVDVIDLEHVELELQVEEVRN